MSAREPALQEAASPKAEVRLHAVSQLAAVPGRESDEALAGLLADPDPRVRARATLALAGPGRRHAHAACLLLLLDPRSGAAGSGAARVLAARRDGADGLLEALVHASPVVRLRAARELPGASPAPEALFEPLSRAARAEEDAAVRGELLLALGRSGNADAAPFLLEALRDSRAVVRGSAAWALGRIGDRRAAARILPLLEDPETASCALEALGVLPSGEAAEELARRGAAGDHREALLVALARAAADSGPAFARRVKALWPGLAEVARARLEAPGVPSATAGALAHLVARLDADGAPALLVRRGPYADGYAAFAAVPDEGIAEAVRTALVTDDPEPAVALLQSGRASVDASSLVAHPHPRARVAALNRLAPGATRLSELLDVLAEDSSESALAAAWALAREARKDGGERSRAASAALHDRAGGPDGPGRRAAIVALRGDPAASADVAVRAGLGSPDPTVRAAAIASAAARDAVTERDLGMLLDDPDPCVRRESLVALARLVLREKAGPDARPVRRFLDDEPVVAAAAAALLVVLGAPDRARVAREMLAQRGAARRGALEAVFELRDEAAAAEAAAAVGHEDPSAARAALDAVSAAPLSVAVEAVAHALGDGRPEVRVAAAAVAARAGEDLAAGLAIPLARALEQERDGEALAALLRAVAAAGTADAIPAVTRVLAADRSRGGAETAEALSQRFPEATRAAWAAAPPRAAQAWELAFEAVRRRPRASLGDDEAEAARLLASLARLRTGMRIDVEETRPRLQLLLAAEAWACGSFRKLTSYVRDLPAAHPLSARLVDSVLDTTSRFFADPAALDALADEIAPERLLALGPGGVFDVWCVGCGTGADAWSVAIRLATRGLERVRVRGTDLSAAAVREAREGVYGPHALRGLPHELRSRHFQALSNGRYRVRDALRDRVYFEARALAEEPPGAGKHDAIVCHGVLSRMPENARPAAVEKLASCLKPGGYLLLGREDLEHAAASPLSPVLLGHDLAFRAPGAVVYTRGLS